MRLSLVASLVVLAAACGPKSTPEPVLPPPGEPQPAHHAVGTMEVIDENGQPFQIAQGEPGDPALVGCADGQREAFVDAAAFPGVAGCIAEWTGTASLRAPGTGATCGDDTGPCPAPADACAPGWHLCGSSGSVAEVAAIGGDACETAGGGRFVAAMSHCKTQEGCEYEQGPEASYACFDTGWCSEPVCCGSDCMGFGSCPSGVWENKTHIPVGTDQGCGAIGSSRARGVLCCR
jgi:hypothetical protein